MPCIFIIFYPISDIAYNHLLISGVQDATLKLFITYLAHHIDTDIADTLVYQEQNVHGGTIKHYFGRKEDDVKDSFGFLFLFVFSL